MGKEVLKIDEVTAEKVYAEIWTKSSPSHYKEAD